MHSFIYSFIRVSNPTLSLQLPDPSQWGCDHVSFFHVYTRGPLQTGFVPYDRVPASIRNVAVTGVDAYANFTIAVSMENSAGLESDMTAVQYIGSKSGGLQFYFWEDDWNSRMVYMNKVVGRQFCT